MTMGVYCIQIEKDNYWQSYVGISNNIERRWIEHKNKLNNNNHRNRYLQYSWNKYGQNAFEFLLLEEVEQYEHLYQLEKEYSYSFGYGDSDLCFNIGTPGEKSAMLGRPVSETTRKKIGASQIGEKNHNFGKKITEEAKQKIREALRGENSYSAKLTEFEARGILTVKLNRGNNYRGDFTQKTLAKCFKVSISCIDKVMCRKKWKHIEPLSEEEYEQFKEQVSQKLKNEGSEKF